MIHSNLIAIIPARGGSKRILHKNIRDFCGLPIIAYTIKSAINSGLFSHVIVSTDDPEIAMISKLFGAEVPFLRDPSLADDYTPVSLATLDVLMHLDPLEKIFTHVAQLMSNCPLRTEEDIIISFRQFIDTKSESQISMTKYGWQNPWWAMTMDESHKIKPIFSDQTSMRSQDLPEIFCPTGAIWWSTCESLRENKTFHTSNRIGWEIPWDHAIDIDTEDDWKMAEMIMRFRESS